MTDLKLALAGTVLQSVGQYYGLSGVTVRQFLDKVFLYNGAAFVDHSAEADTEAGTPFDAMIDANDFLYLGKATRFKEVYANLAVTGSYTGLVWEYWDGDEWKALVTSGAGDGLDADGPITFTPPVDWAKTTVNSQNLYWIRATATAVTTPATVNCIRQNCVVNTDYVLDAGLAGEEGRLPGRIGRLATGMLVDGEEVKVSFTYTTWASAQFPIAGCELYRRGGPPGGAPGLWPGDSLRCDHPQVHPQAQRGHWPGRQEVAGGAHDPGGPGRHRQHSPGAFGVLQEL